MPSMMALDQPAKYRLDGLVAVEREAGDVGLTVHPDHPAVHGLDDIAADAEIAQGWLDAGLQRPLRRADRFAQA